MTIDQKVENGAAVFALGGRLDTTTSSELEAALEPVLGEVTDITFDFENLEYISSAGLRVLLKTQKVMNTKGSMKVIHVNETIMEVFDVTGFTDILTVE